MLPAIPPELLVESWELICCGMSALAALVSYFFLMR
jgi:hypothetical protein